MNNSFIKTIIIVLVVLFCPIAILAGGGALLIPAFIIGAMVYFWCIGQGNANQIARQNLTMTNISATDKNNTGIKLSKREDREIYYYINEFVKVCHESTEYGEKPYESYERVIKEIKRCVKSEYVELFITYFEICKERAQKEQYNKKIEPDLYSIGKVAIEIWYEKGKMLTEEEKDVRNSGFFKKFLIPFSDRKSRY